jgi:hypothetical protein
MYSTEERSVARHSLIRGTVEIAGEPVMRPYFSISQLFGGVLSLTSALAFADGLPVNVSPNWDKVIATSRTDIGIQDCPEPPLYRGSAIHDKIYQLLHDFQGNFSRLQPWYPLPQTAVAELRPPEKTQTFWDFTLMDELVQDFMKATAGHPVVFQPGTVPAWMTSSAPVRFPSDPKVLDWHYGRDAKINNLTAKQFGAYQARLASWYLKGGFKDELGNWHASGHAYKFDYWEPLNEEDQRFSPAELTRLYDAAVDAVRKVDSSMKFVGPTLADPVGGAEYINYFLNIRNHKPGIPIDMVAYHFYTQTESDETPQLMQLTMFREADKFLAAVGYIEAIRKQLLPKAPTDVDELGSILQPAVWPTLLQPIPKSYWTMSGAVWAYMYGNLAAKGIEVLTAAELIDYPGMFAGTTILDWDSGVPNARYWVVKLLHDNFGPGDKVIQPPAHPDDASRATTLDSSYQLYVQPFITPHGDRRILLINKRDHPIDTLVVGATGGYEQHIDADTTTLEPARKITDDALRLPASAVYVVTMPPGATH